MSFSRVSFAVGSSLRAVVALVAMAAMAGCNEGVDDDASADEDGVGGASACLVGCGLDEPKSGGAGGGADAEPEVRPAFGACDGYANEVVDVQYGDGAGHGQDAMPFIVLGPPQGGGAAKGSLDVVTLGNGGSVVLGLGPQRIVDGPGPDFTVFENAFYAGGNPNAPFAEIGSVEVSADGETWHGFPCTATELPFEGCAGWHAVFAGPNDDDADPHDPATSGGESFDLADVGLTEARFVRVVDRADLTGFNGTFDLDAIALVHWTCDAP